MDLEIALEKLANKIGILEVNLTLRDIEIAEEKEKSTGLQERVMALESQLLNAQNAVLVEREQAESMRVKLLAYEKPPARAKPRKRK